MELVGYVIQFKNGMYVYTENHYGTDDLTKAKLMDKKEARKVFNDMKKYSKTWLIQDGIETKVDIIRKVKLTFQFEN
jgi:hypothetical protein